MNEAELTTFIAAVEIALGQEHDANPTNEPLGTAAERLLAVVRSTAANYQRVDLSGDAYARA